MEGVNSDHHTSQHAKACLPHWHRHVELREAYLLPRACPSASQVPLVWLGFAYLLVFVQRVSIIQNNRTTHANWSYAAPPACRTRQRRSDTPVELPRVSVTLDQHYTSDMTTNSLTSGCIKSPSMSKSILCSTSAKFCLVS